MTSRLLGAGSSDIDDVKSPTHGRTTMTRLRQEPGTSHGQRDVQRSGARNPGERRRRLQGLPHRGLRRHGGARRRAPDPGRAGAGPGVRWNCKAGKCGSCSAEINGRPRLMCMTRLNTLDLDEPVTVEPMRAFPLIKDLVTDVSWNFRGQEGHPEVRAAPGRCARRHLADGAARTSIACRSSASASSASCARTSATCCATTTSTTSSSARGSSSTRPRWRCTRSTPATGSGALKDQDGIGYCNITKCCTERVPRAHPHHRQRDHPAQGAGRRSLLRSGHATPPADHGVSCRWPG